MHSTGSRVLCRFFLNWPWERFTKGEKLTTNFRIDFKQSWGRTQVPAKTEKRFPPTIGVVNNSRWRVNSLCLSCKQNVRPSVLGGTCQRGAAGDCQGSSDNQRRKCAFLRSPHMVTTEKDCHKLEPLKFWDLHKEAPSKFIHTSLSIRWVIPRQRKKSYSSLQLATMHPDIGMEFWWLWFYSLTFEYFFVTKRALGYSNDRFL